ncbi:MAG TPA: hypothetical protein PLT91_06005 [Clostridia bacterium]|jgi:menaquinone-dependent protoporphyrinogen IX oxidase|nr:MAG: flavodoxin [Firmicutes bacterium ADurb.Bin146]HOD93482.1 hypothetical protein [Clostridia bacterium]HQM39776.1 hypothetical protein [Clostridia bacterium]
MKTAIVYYSYGGKTKKYCDNMAKEIEADIFEMQTLKRKSFIGNLFSECPKALQQKTTSIKEINLDLSTYDKIILAAPMWAGFPAPAFNNMVTMLPSGKEVEVFIISGGGETKPENKEKVLSLIEKTGSKAIKYTDILNVNI